LKKTWTPTQDAFRKFLHWLNEGAGSGGEKYLELRRRLVFYFERRNCSAADELADETLARVAQKFQEQGEITNLSPAHYCYVTAKYVFLEYVRRPDQGHTSIEDSFHSGQGGLELAAPFTGPVAALQERTFACLESCLKKLSPEEARLILEYYQSDQQEKIQQRKEIAARLGISANALGIRACRIRNKLEACVRSCCEEE